jgi:ribonuclease G
MQDILINWAPQETRVAIVENGAVQELHLERALERGLVGNIYLGKVARVLPGMQSAFIDIGLERAAFLHVADGAHGRAPPRSDNGNTPPTPIERQVFEGQTLTVQVIKDPIGTKGARLSTQISIAGRLLVFLPQDDHIGISQKIGSAEAARAAARPHERPGGQARLRAAPPAASSCAPTPRKPPTTELADDIAYLRKTWAAIRERGFSRPPGTLLHQDLSLVERVLRDLAHEHTQSIRIDSKMQYDLLKAFGEVYTPTLGGQAGALQGRAADLRPVQHR